MEKGKGKRGRPKGSKRKLSGQPIDDDIDESLVIDAYGIDSDIDNEIEEYEAKTNAKHAIVTDGKLTWARVCKHMHKVHNNLPHERHNIYIRVTDCEAMKIRIRLRRHVNKSRTALADKTKSTTSQMENHPDIKI